MIKEWETEIEACISTHMYYTVLWVNRDFFKA